MTLAAVLVALLLAAPAWANPLDANPGAQQGSGNALPGGTITGAAQYRGSATTLAGDDSTIIGNGVVTTDDVLTRCDPGASTCISRFPSNAAHVTAPSGTDCDLYFIDERPWVRCANTDTTARRIPLSVLAVDCTTQTGGRNGDLCFQADGKIYRCVPTAGLCDTSDEWLLTTGATVTTTTSTSTTSTSSTSTTSTTTTASTTTTSTAPTELQFLATVGWSMATSAGVKYGSWGNDGFAEANKGQAAIQIPVAGTLTNLYCAVTAAAGAGDSWIFTVAAGSAPASLAASTSTCTISGASAVACNDTTHTVSVAAGDVMDFKVEATGSPAAGVNARCSVQLQ